MKTDNLISPISQRDKQRRSSLFSVNQLIKKNPRFWQKHQSDHWKRIWFFTPRLILRHEIIQRQHMISGMTHFLTPSRHGWFLLAAWQRVSEIVWEGRTASCTWVCGRVTSCGLMCEQQARCGPFILFLFGKWQIWCFHPHTEREGGWERGRREWKPPSTYKLFNSYKLLINCRPYWPETLNTPYRRVWFMKNSERLRLDTILKHRNKCALLENKNRF